MTNRIELHDRKPLTKKQRVQLFFERKGECCICHGKIHIGEKWIDEHETALALGGTNEMSNRGLAHIDCAKDKTKVDVKHIAKAKRVEAKHIGANKPVANIQSRGFGSRLKSNDKAARIAANHQGHVARMMAKVGMT